MSLGFNHLCTSRCSHKSQWSLHYTIIINKCSLNSLLWTRESLSVVDFFLISQCSLAHDTRKLWCSVIVFIGSPNEKVKVTPGEHVPRQSDTWRREKCKVTVDTGSCTETNSRPAPLSGGGLWFWIWSNAAAGLREMFDQVFQSSIVEELHVFSQCDVVLTQSKSTTKGSVPD